jgi:hypothetical protein
MFSRHSRKCYGTVQHVIIAHTKSIKQQVATSFSRQLTAIARLQPTDLSAIVFQANVISFRLTCYRLTRVGLPDSNTTHSFSSLLTNLKHLAEIISLQYCMSLYQLRVCQGLSTRCKRFSSNNTNKRNKERNKVDRTQLGARHNFLLKTILPHGRQLATLKTDTRENVDILPRELLWSINAGHFFLVEANHVRKRTYCAVGRQ